MNIFSILTSRHDRSEEAIHLGRFRRVAKISFWIALISITGLLFIAVYIDTPDTGYRENISSLVISRRNLDLLLLLTGLWLMAFTAIVTWLITLYSSFRVAGPLYRFSRNLEVVTKGGTVPLIRIRNTDYLQEECELLDASISSLYSYYGELRNQLRELEKVIMEGNDVASVRLFTEIKSQLNRITLDA